MATSSLPTHTASERLNWSGTYRFEAKQIFHPASTAELEYAVGAVSHARAVGTRHSFNGVADSREAQVSTLRFCGVEVDPRKQTARVGAGMRLGELAALLDSQGWALANLPSLPHISLGGCVATATHGSGVKNQNLAALVEAIDYLGADGQCHTLTREHDGESFPGAVVALGCLGVVTHLTVALEPSFQVAQTVYQNLGFDQLLAHLPAVLGAAYSVSVFTQWAHRRAEQVWVKQRLDGSGNAAAGEFFEAPAAQHRMNPAAADPAFCTEQGGKPGPWYERLPHFQLAFTPSSGHEIQSEYFVPLDRGAEALEALSTLAPRIAPLLTISELRTVAADDLWLSMSYGRPSLAIHFTWKPDTPGVLGLLPAIEEALAPFEARPHWGKVFTLGAGELARLYPRLEDFKQLVRKHDPGGVFLNPFVSEKLGL